VWAIDVKSISRQTRAPLYMGAHLPPKLKTREVPTVVNDTQTSSTETVRRQGDDIWAPISTVTPVGPANSFSALAPLLLGLTFPVDLANLSH